MSRPKMLHLKQFESRAARSSFSPQRLTVSLDPSFSDQRTNFEYPEIVPSIRSRPGTLRLYWAAQIDCKQTLHERHNQTLLSRPHEVETAKAYQSYIVKGKCIQMGKLEMPVQFHVIGNARFRVRDGVFQAVYCI